MIDVKKGRKFQRVLVRWRKARGISVNQASKMLGIPEPTLRSWEYGERSCPEYVAALLVEKLEKDMMEVNGK